MGSVNVISSEYIGNNFVPSKFLPKSKDEFHLRNLQNPKPKGYWRNLRSSEIEGLVKNGNTCDNWDDFLVTEHFDPRLIKTSHFFGLVRVDNMKDAILEHHDLQVPAGITNSRIISCDIGETSGIHNVSYMGHYIVGNCCILLNLDEIHTTNHAKFGNGILKDGENEDVRVRLDLLNETGCRSIMPFDGMITADAYIWAKYREDTELQNRLEVITQEGFSSQRGFYGTIGDHCVIKHSRIIKDVKVGSYSYIKGANKLKNLTINSNEKETTQIGEGVEMVNGIIGFGCHIFYGSKAVKFIMGNNCNLKYGARLLNSFMGDNSTVSCCEMLNNLIFPAHEQHHNNSFLISSLVKGQSNMAAGVTVGSNHNSRANDGEIQAGRGFWPGLCSSVKHSCRFASFTLLSKADYPAELDIRLPFALLNNDTANDALQVMPGFWWLYNMYALARNTWKFQTRDKRITKIQNVEFDSLAPDTAEEVIHGRYLLEIWTAKAELRKSNPKLNPKNDNDLSQMGQDLLSGPAKNINGLEILGEGMEKSGRKTLILKVREGYRAYTEMLHYYAVKNLIEYMSANEGETFNDMCEALSGKREKEWANIGGQLIPLKDVHKLFSRIKSNKLNSWDDIHKAYDKLWDAYPLAKQKHAYAVLLLLLETETMTPGQFKDAIDKACKIQELIKERVYTSRKKDYDNPFRQATYRNPEEMEAAIGTPEENSFVKQVTKDTKEFLSNAMGIKKRIQ